MAWEICPQVCSGKYFPIIFHSFIPMKRQYFLHTECFLHTQEVLSLLLDSSRCSNCSVVEAGITFPLLWSMFADIADYSEYRHGRASTGLIFSSSSMAQKFGGAFGSALILWILSAYGYDTAEGAVQTESTMEGLRAMVSFIPATGALVAVIALVFYSLNEKRMSEISEKLADRHEIR